VPLQHRDDVGADYIVRIGNWRGGPNRLYRREEFIAWTLQVDTVGDFQMTEVSNDMIVRFSDRDTAFAAEVLHGSALIHRYDTHRTHKLPHEVVYRGPMDVQTLAELRDWIGDLDPNTWGIELEAMVSPEDFRQKRILLLMFRYPHDAFAFKIRWSLPRD
jgi:hypothetical protein